MKFSGLILSLFSVSGFMALSSVLPKVATAQCVQADVSVQYNISGSKQPTKRSNDVIMESNPTCTGNASVTTGVQGNIGGEEPVEQHRQVYQRQTGGNGNGTGINGPTVQIRTNAPIDVYNAADKFRR
jgi:hypothetical protein